MPAQKDRNLFLYAAAVCLSGLFAIACTDRPQATSLPEAPLQLRVMTFNIEWGGTHISFDSVVEAIQNSNADIVGIQEPEGNLQRLADELGWHYNLRNYAISKFPLVEPQGSDGLYVFVETSPGKVVALANVHLPSDPAGPHEIRDGAELAGILALERATRLPAIKPYLDVLPGLAERGIPVFLTGDFNAPSHQDWTEAAIGSRPFLRYPVDWPVSRSVSEAGFKDSWRVVHPDPLADPGLTWWAARPPLQAYAPDDDDPQDRIDFVWFAGPAEVHDSIIVGEAGRPDVAVSVVPWPSDHRAVVSTLTVQPADMPELLSTGKRVYKSGELIEVILHLAASGASMVVSRIGESGARIAVLETPGGSDQSGRLKLSALPPGHYHIGVPSRNGQHLENEFWVLDDKQPPAIEVGGPSFTHGEAIPVAWNNAPGNRNDYVAVYRPGAPARYEEGDYESGLPWAYVDALPEGRLKLDASNAGWGWPIPPGTYVMRLMEDDGYAILAESASFEVR